MAVNVPVEFWDESTWVRYFREELGAFHAALAGFLEARQEVLGRLSGDLAQVLRGGDRDLALQMLLGGVRQECVDRGVIEQSCFPESSAARFFREKLGFEVSLDALNKLINALKAGKMPQELGKITERETEMVKTLKEVKRLLDEVYRRLSVEMVPKRYEVRDARDLVVAYEEVLNTGLRLLPLYNPFTFFLYSLRLTPKPYLRLMYGEKLFDGGVAALMEKYGVKIGLRIAPGLGKELDEELGFIGHLDDTVGDLVVQIIARLYEVFGEQEFEVFVDKYQEHIAHFCRVVPLWKAKIEGGVVRMWKIPDSLTGSPYAYHDESYHEFLERAAPLAFLGLL
ncbi:MAG: hypothetical protein GU356_06940, partial [Pyrobaculum sp.]|nr:hypothetical protein [Pyrobaculum sp.]